MVFGDGSAPDLKYADKVFQSLDVDEALVPATWGLEVANVLTRAVLRGDAAIAETDRLIRTLLGLDIKTDAYTSDHALTDTLDLARRYNLSSYDASYLELALRRSLPLATLDTSLRKAARKAGISPF